LSRAWLGGVLAAAIALQALSPALAQEDPLQLQRQAIQRLEHWRNELKRTLDVTQGREELQRAQEELERSNATLRQKKEWQTLTLGLVELGGAYRGANQYRQALACYEEALKIARERNLPALAAQALRGKAIIASSNDAAFRNLGQALSDAREAVAMAERQADAGILSSSFNTLADIQARQGDTVGAADTATKAIEVAGRTREPYDLIEALLTRADLYRDAADRCRSQAAPNYDYAACRRAVELAITDNKRVLAIAEEKGYTGLAESQHTSLQFIAALQQSLAGIEKYGQNIKSLRLKNPPFASDKNTGAAIIVPSFAQQSIGDPKAIAALEQQVSALQEVQRRAGMSPSEAEASNAALLASLSEWRGDYPRALALYERAIVNLEKDRRAIQEERNRGAFMERGISAYYGAIRVLLQTGRSAEAYEMMERAQGRVLSDLVATRPVSLADPAAQNLFAQAIGLRARIARLQAAQFEQTFTSSGAQAAAPTSPSAAEIDRLQQQYSKVLDQLAARSPQTRNLLVGKPITLKDLQTSMRRENYSVLQYQVHGMGVFVWRISAEEVEVKNIYVPDLELLVRSLRQSLENRPQGADQAFDAEISGHLYRYLIEPFRGKIKTNRLVIIPQGELSQLPFQALRDPASGAFLGETYELSTAPSATLLLAMKPTPSLSGARLLAIADPSLPHAVDEVRAIATGGAVPLEPKVLPTKADLGRWAKGQQVVHLAVHGQYEAQEPMLSFLKLAPRSSTEGHLTAAEMFALPLDQARLVVLSGCETGRLMATMANDQLGLITGLLYAGAGNLLLSQWRVDDKATELWMGAFYKAAHTQPLAAAARQAMLQVKSRPEYRHPFYWAAYSLVGR